MSKRLRPIYTHHARDRAFERYGVDLTDAEMGEIFHACATGKALCGRSNSVGHIFMYRVRGNVLVIPALSLDKTFIATFMPLDYFCSGNTLNHCKRKGTAKQRQRHSKTADGMNYKRERITVRQAEDEL